MTAFYAVFAARINEGSKHPKAGCLVLDACAYTVGENPCVSDDCLTGTGAGARDGGAAAQCRALGVRATANDHITKFP